MISPRRIVAAAALAAGFTGLAAPLANAAEAPDAGKLNPIAALDALAASQLPQESRGELPKISRQLSEVKNVHQLSKLNELHQLTDLAAPVTGLLPAIET
ncbi:hypothetical protein JCM4814A_46460 [Streptomyces phaeofaciens JCM 4814]|uniref:Secreted protein n=1 Tax=Streptomyces phaeofaciens TaxID=68254 RepID=A0A918H2E4_9ACTN|nr:hypothetical protein [Streptomyces phaeofaciens]GGT30604.1 hypothetical protein GCM10010226_03140 [Streptomyces phaeofaciens]